MIKTENKYYNIETIHLKKDYYFNNKIILNYDISYPKIMNNILTKFTSKFNRHYEKYVYEKMIYCDEKLYPRAIDDFKYKTANGREITNYVYISESNIAYNDNCLISICTDEYEYMGGAHGITKRHSENWNGIEANKLKLKNLFLTENYKFEIIEIINKEIEKEIEEGSYYFDDYKINSVKYFNEDSFYLYDDGIIIYYQQYELAPYVKGLPEFKISQHDIRYENIFLH